VTRQQLEIVARISRLCEELPASRDRLDVINLAWLAFQFWKNEEISPQPPVRSAHGPDADTARARDCLG